MSDDDEYYEWDEDYLYEELVPDLVVSIPADLHNSTERIHRGNYSLHLTPRMN